MSLRWVDHPDGSSTGYAGQILLFRVSETADSPARPWRLDTWLPPPAGVTRHLARGDAKRHADNAVNDFLALIGARWDSP